MRVEVANLTRRESILKQQIGCDADDNVLWNEVAASSARGTIVNALKRRGGVKEGGGLGFGGV
jgi:hypothetical protein